MSDIIDNAENADIPDNTDMADIADMVDAEINQASSKARKNKTFEKACEHCNKVLKSVKSYENHINTQVCYNRDEITYCKLCKITMPNHIDYVKHLISMEHINKIGCNKLEVLHSNQPSTILQADPYLTSNEARSIGTNNLGNKFTFVFNNNDTKVINLVHQNDANTSNNRQNIIKDNANANANTNANDKQHIMNAKKIEATPKQIKILGLLNNANTVVEGGKLLLIMLDNKLHLEDYNGLQYIIKNDVNMKMEYKTAYLEIIDKFVSMLVKRRSAGETIYKDKDISKVVLSLTI